MANVTYQAGGIVFTTDGECGFNMQNRQSMLDAQAAKWPAATTPVSAAYGIDAPILYKWVDPANPLVVRVSILHSSQGSRMGCIWGTALFCFNASDVFSALVKGHPNFTVRCATDDFTSMAVPSDGDYQALYRQVAEQFRTFTDLGRPIGLRANSTKTFLLLSPGAPDPAAGVLPPEIQVTRAGIIVTGGAVGPDSFIGCFASDAIDDFICTLRRMEPFLRKYPQAGLRLVTVMARAPTYLARVTPPHLLRPHAERFDAALWRCLGWALSPEGVDDFECPDTRLRSVQLLVSMPFKAGGLGLGSLFETCGPAFFASVIEATRDPMGPSILLGYDAVLRRIHAELLGYIEAAGGFVPGSPLDALFPRSADSAVDPAFWSSVTDSSLNTQLQKVLVRAVSSAWQADFLAQVRDVVLSGVPSEETTVADAVHRFLIVLKGQMSRIFTSDLYHKSNRVGAKEFRAYVRYYMNLPQLVRLHNGFVSEVYGFTVDLCQCGDHTNVLDPTANHVCSTSCKLPPAAAINRLHRLIVLQLHAYAKVTGADSTVEPLMVDTLLGEYTPEEARMICPKKVSQEANAKALGVVRLQHALRSATGPQRLLLQNELDGLVAAGVAAAAAGRRIAQLKREIRGASGVRLHRLQSELSELCAGAKAVTKARRLDLGITARDLETVMLDVKCVHPTCDSYLDGARAFVRKFILHAEIERDGGPRNLMRAQNSRPVVDGVQRKLAAYAVLLEVVELQLQSGVRSHKNRFFAPVMSHSGELSSDFFSLLNWLYAKHLLVLSSEPPRRDGRSSRVVANAAAKLCRDGLAGTMAHNFGSTVACAGVGGARLRPLGAFDAGA
jgi:hypothetical protein